MVRQADESAVTAKEKPAGTGILVVCVIAELPYFQACSEQICLRQTVRRIIFHKAPVGAEPEHPVAILENAMDHVIDQPVLLADMLRMDIPA